MIPLLGSVLAAGLLGSPHCAAMCGGFVCFYNGQPGASRRAPWVAHLAYNGGRLLSYVVLGAVAGALGAGIDRAGAAAGLGRAAAVHSGALLIGWGAAGLLRAAGVRLPDLTPTGASHRGVAAALRSIRGAPAELRALVLGLVTTLLPCGFLYAFVATASGTGSPAAGAFVMAAFWLGTLPVMAGLGLALRRAVGPIQRSVPVLTAAALLVIGLLTVSGRLQAGPTRFIAEVGSHVCH